MSSIASVFDRQAAGYERNVHERWDSLDQWERDYYQEFVAWAGDKGTFKRAVLAPERRGYRPASNVAGHGSLPLTVGLAYLTIVVGLFIFPLYVQAVALGLGVINVARGRWGHGLVQLAAAGVALALIELGALGPGETVDTLRELIARYR